MKKVLIIDDNEPDRVLYKRYLGQHIGHERLLIYEAASGTEGISQFQTIRPDCVLLDHHLLDTDGLTMLAQLKQLTPPDTLCVVMITGGGSETLAVRALNGGALDYLVKHKFDQSMLCKTVTHAIEKNEWRQYVTHYHEQLQGINQQLLDSLAELTETRQQIQEKNTQLLAANAAIETRNQELARTNADLDNFVYAASHDLRQPVNNLQGLLKELQRTAPAPDAKTGMVWQFVNDSLRNLSKTIDDLATVVQAQRMPGGQAPELVDLKLLTADVLETLQPQVQAAQATIQTDFTALPELLYVRSNLRTILLNLLANAIKYCHPDRLPIIQVRAYPLNGLPVLEVQDNGLGLDLERHRDQLFQLFRRFHPQTSEGTGVGLFLVNRLVQSQNGRIEVESEAGQGALFRLYLHG